jgi:hypothetical protein
VAYDPQGLPHHVNYGLLSVLNLAELQALKQRIEVLEAALGG